MDNIGSFSDLVVTGFRQSRGWEPHSHPVGNSSDRVDIQRSQGAAYSVGCVAGFERGNHERLGNWRCSTASIWRTQDDGPQFDLRWRCSLPMV